MGGCFGEGEKMKKSNFRIAKAVNNGINLSLLFLYPLFKSRKVMGCVNLLERRNLKWRIVLAKEWVAILFLSATRC